MLFLPRRQSAEALSQTRTKEIKKVDCLLFSQQHLVNLRQFSGIHSLSPTPANLPKDPKMMCRVLHAFQGFKTFLMHHGSRQLEPLFPKWKSILDQSAHQNP